MEKTIGTIKLDLPGEPDGKLIWSDGSIYCVQPDGVRERVEDLDCPLRKATAMVVQAYGERLSKHKVWGLRLASRQASRHYGI